MYFNKKPPLWRFFWYNINMKTGTVKIWQKERGYGYITPDEGGADVYVHFNGIDMVGFKSLQQGERVSYVLVQGYKDYQAAEVKPIMKKASEV